MSAQQLIDRLLAGELSNELDVLIEIATFEPCDTYSAARANAAGTKVIYTRRDGSDETCWARDWCKFRPRAVAALTTTTPPASQSEGGAGHE